jgi:hypothetical protein
VEKRSSGGRIALKREIMAAKAKPKKYETRAGARLKKTTLSRISAKS